MSLGDQDHSKTNPISEDGRPECCSAVCKDEVCVPNARSFKVVETSEKRGWRRPLSELSKMLHDVRNFLVETQQRGMVDGKQGMIQEREQIWQVFPW